MRECGGVFRVERVRGDGVGERVDVVFVVEDVWIGVFFVCGVWILECDCVCDVGGEFEVVF